MSDSTQKDPQVIFCDVCTDEDRKPARKTCMKCEISMCVQHLQIHLTTPALIQTHPLTEPMALCGTTKCTQHGKLLEYYCLDDRTCLCVSCAIEDQHRLHNMKTFSTAHKELMEKLSAEQQALLVKTDDENVSLEKWEKSEREKLGRCSVRLIEAVSKMRDAALTSVQSSVSARMVAMKTSKSSMQAAQEEKDTFRFLQMYSQVHQDMEKAKAVDLRKGLEPGSDRDKLVEEMRQGGEKMTEQADQLWCSLLTLVDPENHQELIYTDSDLIFDPQVLGPCMSLSESKKMVFYNSWMGQCSATLLISSIKSVPNFQRWVINLSEDYDWTVGLCDKQSAKNLKDGNVFGLCCKGDQLSFLTTEYDDCSDASMPPTKKPCRVSSKTIKYSDCSGNSMPPIKEPCRVSSKTSKYSDCSDASMPPTKKPCRVSSKTIKYSGKKGDEDISRPEMVEVFWNRAASSLSFFSRTGQHQREEVLTIKMKINNSDLVAFVQLGEENTPNSSDWPHQQWRCSCGQIYSRRMNKYGNGMCQYSHQGNCSCGAIIGDACITKIICQLV